MFRFKKFKAITKIKNLVSLNFSRHFNLMPTVQINHFSNSTETKHFGWSLRLTKHQLIKLK